MVDGSVARIYMVLIITGYSQASTWTKFERCSCFDGFTCHPGDIVFEASYKNVSGCAIQARQYADCFSIFYDPLQFFCYGCTMFKPPGNGKNKGLKHYAKKVCPTDTTFRWGRSCYLVGPSDNNFTQAMDFCKERNKYLLQLETEAENQMFLEFINDVNFAGSFVWLGLTDVRETGTWVWETTEAAVDFEYWDTSADSDPNKHCGAFMLGLESRWGKVKCYWASSDTLTVCEVGMSN